MKITKFAVAAVLTIGAVGTSFANDQVFATKMAAMCAGIMAGQKANTGDAKYERASTKFNERGISLIKQGYLSKDEYMNIGMGAARMYGESPNSEKIVGVTRTCNDMANSLGYFR